MELTFKKGFDFKLLNKQVEEIPNSNTDIEKGDFSILYDGQSVGILSVTSLYGVNQVSAEIPEVNFSVSEWMSFFNLIKELFRIHDTQSIMLNRYPQSVEMCV